MTVAEIYRWPFERNWSEQRRQRLVLAFISVAVTGKIAIGELNA